MKNKYFAKNKSLSASRILEGSFLQYQRSKRILQNHSSKREEIFQYAVTSGSIIFYVLTNKDIVFPFLSDGSPTNERDCWNTLYFHVR